MVLAELYEMLPGQSPRTHEVYISSKGTSLGIFHLKLHMSNCIGNFDYDDYQTIQYQLNYFNHSLYQHSGYNKRKIIINLQMVLLSLNIKWFNIS